MSLSNHAGATLLRSQVLGAALALAALLPAGCLEDIEPGTARIAACHGVADQICPDHCTVADDADCCADVGDSPYDWLCSFEAATEVCICSVTIPLTEAEVPAPEVPEAPFASP